MPTFTIETLAEKHELSCITAPTHGTAAWQYAQRLIGVGGEAYRETGAPHHDGTFRLWEADKDPIADKKPHGLVQVTQQ